MAAPMVKTASFHVSGSTLFDTLVLNLVAYDPERGYPCEASGNDRPAWERDEPARVIERCPEGYLDFLTWQSRRMHLVPDPADPTHVVQAVVLKGESFAEGFQPMRMEQFVAFRRNLNPKQGEPWYPLGFHEERALWRDTMVLLPDAQEGRPPALFEWLASADDASAPYNIMVVGLVSDQAKALFWRQENLVWPQAYLTASQELRAALGEALQLAERVGTTLGGGYTADKRPTALRILALELQGEHKGVREFAANLQAERTYWSALDRPFRELLLELPTDVETFDGMPTYGKRLLASWAKTLQQQARNAFREATTGFWSGGRSLCALANAERAFEFQLSEALKPYLSSEKERDDVADRHLQTSPD